MLRGISAAQGFDLSDASFDASQAIENDSVEVPPQEALIESGTISQIVSASDVISHVDVCPQGEVIALRINPESHPGNASFVEADMENTIESANQIQ